MVLAASLTHRRTVQIGLIFLVLLIALLAYAPGTSGPLHFDDEPNLGGLADITDWRSAVIFVSTGEAGRLGRPVALATFLPHSDHWPHQLSSMLWTNILIHILNGLLVAWLALKLGLARNLSPTRAGYLAIATCAIWTLMPLLASSSLLLVQRMTTVSAAFLLLGLIGFVHGHQRLEQSRRRAYWTMSLSLLLMTPLAALSKENGILLPLLALIISLTILSTPSASVRASWKIWSFIFLWLPALGLLFIFAAYLPYPESTLFMRNFSAWERLLTQAGILWQYLFHAFIPTDTAFFGPFHDDYTPARSLLESLTLLAVLAWVATVVSAIALRRRAPIFTFAVFWFLGGHLLESTLLPLDLYFEHRNYIPLVGPAFALAWLIVNAPERYRKVAASGAVVYSGLLALTLWVIATQWGNPLQAAEEQYRHNPDSSRALGHYSKFLLAMDLVEPALELLDDAVDKEIAPERLLASRIYFQCRHYPDRGTERATDNLISRLPQAAPDRNLAKTLHGLVIAATEYHCGSLSSADAERIIAALAAHPEYRYRNSYWYHVSRAQVAQAGSATGQYHDHLERALVSQYRHDTMIKLIKSHLARDGIERACQKIKEQWQRAPLNPLRRLGRLFQLQEAADRINQASESADDCRLRGRSFFRRTMTHFEPGFPSA